MPDLLDQTGYTFDEHLLALAEAVGLARSIDDNGNPLGDDATVASRLPADPTDLDMLRRAWNEGYAAFCSGADPLARAGRKPYVNWTFLNQTVTITLAPGGDGPQNIRGDSSRYRLPAGISSGPKHAWTLEVPGVLGTRIVEDTSSQRVMTYLASLSATASSSGYPFMAACRPIPAPEGEQEGGAWEVVVAPMPNFASTMSAQFRLVARRLRNGTDRHICGAQHDPALRAFAVMEWFRRDVDKPEKFQRVLADAAAKLDASVEMDKQMAPRVSGMIHDPGVGAIPVTRSQARARSGTIVTVTQ